MNSYVAGRRVKPIPVSCNWQSVVLQTTQTTLGFTLKINGDVIQWQNSWLLTSPPRFDSLYPYQTMESIMYSVAFERGDCFLVDADSENEALNKVFEFMPQLVGCDILRVEKESTVVIL